MREHIGVQTNYIIFIILTEPVMCCGCGLDLLLHNESVSRIHPLNYLRHVDWSSFSDQLSIVIKNVNKQYVAGFNINLNHATSLHGELTNVVFAISL